jgi:hypothetical protein
MNDTQAQITEQPASPPPAPLPELTAPPTPSVRKQRLPRWLSKTLNQVASLRVTVVLFVLSIFLVFAGTVAQVDAGIWTVVEKYFRSFYVWVPLQIFFPRDWKIAGGFPFPGGWLLGSLLLINLLAAHAMRFKLTWKRTGIILLHAGLIVIMVSELITGLFALEGTMLIREGQSSNFVYHARFPELSVMPVGTGDSAEYTVIPVDILRKKDGPIHHEALPFDVEVVHYMVNSHLCRLGPPEFHAYMQVEMKEVPEAPSGTANPATAGLGAKYYVALDRPEVGGVDTANKEDLPAAYVRLRHRTTGKDLGTYLLALALMDEPQYVTVDGKKYDIRLRAKRSYKDYTVHLLKAQHDKYIGTEKPKNYSSEIRLVDPTQNVDRKVLISMNDPLRYGGETFYQNTMSGSTSGLQVVRNPGWLMPYISCVMVALGMMIHFGANLQTFLARRAAQ